MSEFYYSGKICQIVDFNKDTDGLFQFNFTETNQELTEEIWSDTLTFSGWIDSELSKRNCRYGIGGYNELRKIYSRSTHFDGPEEPRRLHLGTDIWGPAGTLIYCPVEGMIHSFRYNEQFGDYGATIILQHEHELGTFFSLYGHLSLRSIENISVGQFIEGGSPFADLGQAEENGGWPPHLHFQLIRDMQGNEGDYPGVCRFSEREQYLENCPNPDIILSHTFQ